jgi:hypothetical protein
MSQHQTFPFGMERRARGVVSNASGRYETRTRAYEPDAWAPQDEAPLRTQVSIEVPRRVISYNRSPDLPFDRSINPYRECGHGCIYCFARPTPCLAGHVGRSGF